MNQFKLIKRYQHLCDDLILLLIPPTFLVELINVIGYLFSVKILASPPHLEYQM